MKLLGSFCFGLAIGMALVAVAMRQTPTSAMPASVMADSVMIRHLDQPTGSPLREWAYLGQECDLKIQLKSGEILLVACKNNPSE